MMQHAALLGAIVFMVLTLPSATIYESLTLATNLE